MGRVSDRIDDAVRKFIEAQPIYFVATAPLSASGLVNVSPKGLDTFRIVDEKTVAYLDLTGSGVETVAHVRENSRIAIMFCAFQGPPNILRLHGRARVVAAQDTDFAGLKALFPEFLGTRSIIVVSLQRVGQSCGFGVPLMRYEGEREQLGAWSQKKGPEGIAAYRADRNRVSLDGLPGI